VLRALSGSLGSNYTECTLKVYKIHGIQPLLSYRELEPKGKKTEVGLDKIRHIREVSKQTNRNRNSVYKWCV
jgi:hypothetical protein